MVYYYSHYNYNNLFTVVVIIIIIIYKFFAVWPVTSVYLYADDTTRLLYQIIVDNPDDSVKFQHGIVQERIKDEIWGGAFQGGWDGVWARAAKFFDFRCSEMQGEECTFNSKKWSEWDSHIIFHFLCIFYDSQYFSHIL